MMKATLFARFFLSSAILLAPFARQTFAATNFDQQEVNQGQFIAIARPYGDKKHDLLILQQLSGQKQCWQEQPGKPTSVVPLLLNFDFTGICDRSTDSNGYSIRIDGKDYGLDYLLRIVERNGDLWLVGTHRVDAKQPEIIIGHTYGIGQGFLKIVLEPGWRFSKRAFNGRALGHVYLTGDRSAMQVIPSTVSTKPTPLPRNPVDRTLPKPLQEYTFTADSPPPNPANNAARPPLSPLQPLSSRRPTPLPPLPVTPTNSASVPPISPLPSINPRPNSRSLPPPPVPRAINPSPINGTSSSLPPVPVPSTRPLPSPLPPLVNNPAPTPSFSTLPPLPPPTSVTNPPPLPSSGSGRKTLSDILTVSPRSTAPNNANSGNLGGNLDRVPPPSNVAANYPTATGYRVLVNPGGQQAQVRSLYPDAFPTSYQGRSVWQIGRFSSQENAQKALNDLATLGVNGVIVQ